jgi:AraC-like DNA-binding protein
MASPSRPTQFREAPQSLTEYRTEIGGDESQLSFFSVQDVVHRIPLRAPHLTYYGVVDGHTVVRSDGEEDLALDPGESLVVPPLQTITVGFPKAHKTPVRYVVLKIDREKMRTVLDRITDPAVTDSSTPGRRREDPTYCHLERREGVTRVLNMMAYLFRENPPNRDRLIDLNAMELIIQMLQTPSRPLLVGELPRTTSTGGLAAAVQYIQDNLDRHISIDELVEEACMSKSSFYRHFGDEFDMSPLEYITRERVIRARELLSDSDNTVTSVSHALGFSSTSHFIDMFKEHEGVTPKQYQLEVTE